MTQFLATEATDDKDISAIIVLLFASRNFVKLNEFITKEENVPCSDPSLARKHFQRSTYVLKTTHD